MNVHEDFLLRTVKNILGLTIKKKRNLRIYNDEKSIFFNKNRANKT